MVGLHTSQMFQKGCLLKIFRLASTVLDSYQIDTANPDALMILLSSYHN